MTFRFKLEVVRVECAREQISEWGKDEMRLFGAGVSRKGSAFTTGVRSLGSYHEGDVRTGSPLPMILFETDLPNDGLEVLFHVWLIEEDGGGIRDSEAAIEATFREAFLEKAEQLGSIGFPRECIPFAAFDKALPAVQARMESARTKGRNDTLFFPSDRLLKFNEDAVTPHSSSLSEITSARHGAIYHVAFRHSYDQVSPGNLPG